MLKFPLIAALTLFVLFLLPAQSWAIQIRGDNAAEFNRWSSGYPANPIPNTNPAFVARGLDLSGVGWVTSNGGTGVTLISPQHVLIASHVAPSLKSFVSFVNRDGVVKKYKVESRQEAASDLSIMKLYNPIPESDHISHYPIYVRSTTAEYKDVKVLFFGLVINGSVKTPKIGYNEISFVTSGTLIMKYGDGHGDTLATSGDSGSPTMVNVNGRLALVGVHQGAQNPSTYDAHISYYVSQLNNKMKSMRVRPATDPIYTVTTLPTAADAWLATKFAEGEIEALYSTSIARWDADPDGDGKSNLLEYVTGSEPKVADEPSPETFALDDGAGQAVFTFTRARALPDVSLAVESTGDLASAGWEAVPAAAMTNIDPDPASPTYQVEMRRDLDPAVERNFFRLQATLLPFAD